MRRNIPTYGLLLASMSAIIGSGWLFASAFSASMAGSAAILAWIIGGVMVIVIAFVFAEICTMVPVTGASSRIPHFTHGALVSYVFAWIIWLGYLIYAPAEVQAMIQYLAVYFPQLAHQTGSLTVMGYSLAAIMLLAFSILNFYSLRWLLRVNSIITVIKIIIPIVVSIIILSYFFSSFNTVAHPGGQPFEPFGMHGVFMAIAAGGIIFAFNGFKLAAEMAGEAINPKKALPIAIVGSVVICLVIYLLLQFAFLSSVSTEALAHGWGGLTSSTKLGPFASIAFKYHLNSLVPLIYAGAIIAPVAAGLIYFSSAGKSLYGMSKNGYLPAPFSRLNSNDSPVFAVCINFVVGFLIFAIFPGWDNMATMITVLFALSYLIGPVNLYTMRERLPNMARPFKLPFGRVWSVVAMFACSLMIYWCGWNMVLSVGVTIAIGLVFMFSYRFSRKHSDRFPVNFKQSIWLWIYFACIGFVSYDGSYGGHDILSIPVEVGILLGASVVCTILAAKMSLSGDEMLVRIKKAMSENDNSVNSGISH